MKDRSYSAQRRQTIELRGFIEAFRGMVEALEEARDNAAPIYREAVDVWATETTKRAKQNLNRPDWLLSKSMGSVVREYKQRGRLWSMAGVLHDGKNVRDPGRYVGYHESGWKPNGGKPSAPPHFLRNAKQATAPILKQKVKEANAQIVKVLEKELSKRLSKKGTARALNG